MLELAGALVLGAGLGVTGGFFLAQEYARQGARAALLIAERQRAEADAQALREAARAQGEAQAEQAKAVVEAIGRKAEADVEAVKAQAAAEIEKAQVEMEWKTARADAMKAGRAASSADREGLADLLVEVGLPAVKAEADKRGIALPEQITAALGSDIGKGMAKRVLSKQLKGLI